MGACLVGMACHGGVIPVGGTFFVFSDYTRPTLRLAAMSRAKAVFAFSHDSVGVGEDGPTHQPIEHLAALRAIPGLQLIRPADANETAAAWRVAVEHDGPTALILSRQGLRVVTDGSAVERGGAVIRDATAPAQVVLLGTGSEVALCVEASRAARGRGRRRSGGLAAVVGPLRGSTRRVPAPPCSHLVSRCSPWRPPRRSAGPAGPTTRSASTASAPARRVPSLWTTSASTWSMCSPAPELSSPLRPIREDPDGPPHPSLQEQGQSPWLDNLTRGYITSGQLAEPARRRHPRPHLEPDHLPEGHRGLARVRRPVPHPGRRRQAGSR